MPSPLKNFFTGRNIFILGLFLLVYSASFTVRTLVFEREKARIAMSYDKNLNQPPAGTFVPLSIESGMMYSYASSVAEGKGIPKYDGLVIGSEKVRVCEQDTVALEYFLGWGYRLKKIFLPDPEITLKDQIYEPNPYFTNWVRFQIRVWASLIAGILFLWLIVLRCPWPLALAGGLLHAVSPAAIARYTGQDIVRGDFSLPILMTVFLIAYWFLSNPSKFKLALLGIVSFSAIASWDMSQICLSVWGLSEIARISCGGIINDKRRKMWTVILISAVLAAILIPYHRTHRLIFSPLVMLMLPSIILVSFAGRKMLYKKRMLLLLSSIVVFFGVWWLASHLSTFADNYGHFSNLIKAKIEHHNVKPANPLLLNFDARILWTPAMHSADKMILREFFPFAIYVVPLLLIMALFTKSQRRGLFGFCTGRTFFPFFMTVTYFVFFIFLVRYHSFAILFLCILLPLLFHDWLRHLKHGGGSHFLFIWCSIFTMTFLSIAASFIFKGKALVTSWTAFAILCAIIFAGAFLSMRLIKKIFSAKTCMNAEKIALGAFVFLAILTELAQTSRMVRNYDGYYLSETAGLIKWLRFENVESEIFLADFTLSPLLKGYCAAGIVLHPKFELGQTRKNVEDYLNIIYNGTEQSLNKFCVEKNAKYYIFDRGYDGDMGIYSARYCAAATVIKNDSPVNKMFIPKERDKLRTFYEIEPPPYLKFVRNKYIVFKVITPEDCKNSQKFMREVKKFMSEGDIESAKRFTKAAVFADPLNSSARVMFIQLFGDVPDVRLRGF